MQSDGGIPWLSLDPTLQSLTSNVSTVKLNRKPVAKELGRCSLQGYTSMVKHLPAMRETRVQSLGWEDPLEKEMATHSSILAWKIPWIEEPGGLQSIDSQRVGHD